MAHVAAAPGRGTQEAIVIRHLFKLVWNRKRSTALVVLEIFCSFLVVFVIATASLHFATNYKRPLGFDYQNVWHISVDMKVMSDDQWTPEMVTRMGRLLAELRTIPQVEAAANAQIAPYQFGDMNGIRSVDGHSVEISMNQVTDDFAKVMSMKMSRGRWFSAEDDAATYDPVIMNRRAATIFFGTDAAVGRVVPQESALGMDHGWRVVGVVDEFRKGGELSGNVPYIFMRKRVDQPKDRPGPNLLVRMAPGTRREVEQTIVAKLRGIAPEWSYEIKPLSEERRSAMRFTLIPIGIGATIAAFMMLMVGLGLLGVLWQNVALRYTELGLRRAVGASKTAIRRQVLTETIAVATFGLVVAVILIAQIPILGLIPMFPRTTLATGLVLSLAIMYGFVMICAYYPSRIATQIEPANALRAE
jgi:putative ABC transport system permease protein